MKYLLLFYFLFVTVAIANAQTRPQVKGVITGKVTDSVTKVPVDYATVSVYKPGSDSPFNGVVTDAKGNFSLTDLAPGSYRITIDFIGYNRKTIAKVTVGDITVALGNITLASSQKQLKTVNIVSKVPTVENKIDKLVYNAANDLTSQGGVAVDVLKKVPMVTVDVDGNVELQGNANIRFLINGKPSSIFGASLADALQTIPASQIKSIEVITSPGAKYDANGTGGIINIILKDSKVQGVNGNINLSAGTRRENGSFNLNVRKGNFGVNAFFSGNEQINSTTQNHTDNLSYNGARDTSNHLLQNGTTKFKRGGYQSGISFNWSITKKDELTASFGYNHFSNHNVGVSNQDQTTTALANNTVTSDLLSLRNSNSRFTGKYFDYSVNYHKTFDREGQELDVLFSSSYGNNYSNFFQQQDYLTGGYPSSGTESTNPGTDHETDISVDYTQPVSKKLTIETGAKAVIENINNSVVTDTLSDGTFVPNPGQTYGFNYKRQVYSYYLSATFSLFNDFLSGKAGLRDEYTSTSADFPGVHIPGYNTLAPSIVFSHKLDETQSFKLSYTYRIQRPDYGNLNPFYNISDPHNISTGNPNLSPEIGHNYEFGYNKSFEKGGSIYIGAFYRHNSNDLQSYTTFYDSLKVGNSTYYNVYLNQQYNIGTENTTGINLFGSVPVTSKLTLRSNMMLGDRRTTNPGNPTVDGFNYRINLNATYDFGHSLVGEVFGNYNSTQKTIQGQRPAFAFYNFAVRKLFWNKQASIGFTAANPFGEYVNQTTKTSGDSFTQTSLRQVPFRSFGISLSYKFGKLEFKKDKDKDENNDNPDQPTEDKNKR